MYDAHVEEDSDGWEDGSLFPWELALNLALIVVMVLALGVSALAANGY